MGRTRALWTQPGASLPKKTACPSAGDYCPDPPPTPQRQGRRGLAFQGDCDAADLRSNTFSLEWPPGSGRQVDFPEVDRAAWFTLEEAKAKISRGQLGFLEELRGC